MISKQDHLVDEHCAKAISIAIEDRSTENGEIETWIIPRENLNKNQTKQDYFNSSKWGKGPDVEVVANFLYALFLYDAEKYFGAIKKGVDYLISEQNIDGHWESRWYYGKYYGTYVCLRLLNCFPKEFFETKQKSLNFLKTSQHENGSFGSEENLIMSTSFARLSLNFFLSENSTINFRNSERFLLNNQLIDGSWKAENFIKPKTNEPYKSKTLTTAFVLKSLI